VLRLTLGNCSCSSQAQSRSSRQHVCMSAAPQIQRSLHQHVQHVMPHAHLSQSGTLYSDLRYIRQMCSAQCTVHA
jgi:hypothetical protein